MTGEQKHLCISHLSVCIFFVCVFLSYQVAVDDVCRVDVLEAAEDLVDEVLNVFVSEGVVAVDDLVQVRVHVVQDNVELLKRARRGLQVTQPDAVFVLEVAKQLDFAQDALGVDQVVE